MKYKNRLLFLTLLGMTYLFSCNLIPKEILKLIVYAIFACFFFVGFNGVKGKLNSKYSSVHKLFKYCIIGIFCSVFIAVFKEKQPFIISIMTIIPCVIPYILYFLLFKNKIDYRTLERYILLISLLSIGVVCLTFATIPDPLFGEVSLELNRGGWRLRLHCYYYIVFALFFFTNQYTIKHKTKHLIAAVICYLFIIPSLGRVMLLTSLCITFWIFLQNTSFFRKVVTLGVILIFGLLVVPQTSIYKNMSEITTSQRERNEDEDDIRKQDYQYFLFDSQKSISDVLFGHGKASYGNSDFGKREEKRISETYIIQADTGWPGLFYDFGLIHTLSLLLLTILGIMMRTEKEFIYVRYFIILLAVNNLTGGSLFYPQTSFLISVCMYLIIISNYRLKMAHKVCLQKITH